MVRRRLAIVWLKHLRQAKDSSRIKNARRWFRCGRFGTLIHRLCTPLPKARNLGRGLHISQTGAVSGGIHFSVCGSMRWMDHLTQSQMFKRSMTCRKSTPIFALKSAMYARAKKPPWWHARVVKWKVPTISALRLVTILILCLSAAIRTSRSIRIYSKPQARRSICNCSIRPC